MHVSKKYDVIDTRPRATRKSLGTRLAIVKDSFIFLQLVFVLLQTCEGVIIIVL